MPPESTFATKVMPPSNRLSSEHAPFPPKARTTPVGHVCATRNEAYPVPRPAGASQPVDKPSSTVTGKGEGRAAQRATPAETEPRTRCASPCPGYMTRRPKAANDQSSQWSVPLVGGRPAPPSSTATSSPPPPMNTTRQLFTRGKASPNSLAIVFFSGICPPGQQQRHIGFQTLAAGSRDHDETSPRRHYPPHGRALSHDPRPAPSSSPPPRGEGKEQEARHDARNKPLTSDGEACFSTSSELARKPHGTPAKCSGGY